MINIDPTKNSARYIIDGETGSVHFCNGYKFKYEYLPIMTLTDFPNDGSYSTEVITLDLLEYL